MQYLHEATTVRNLAWLVILTMGIAIAQEADLMKLPAPETEGGMPLMQALKQRHSTRELREDALPLQVLSNLLWAASGVNRPQTGQRTAPTARDWREIDVYVALANGTYRFEPDTHALRRVLPQDLRALTGTQDFPARAPVNLVYVASLDRMHGTTDEHRQLYSATDTGFIAQNVYLYCASAGLATVVRGSVDREALGAALGLGPAQRVILAQSVGYPE
jgi:SagB-type dehydrogenase family enzyme